MDDANDVFRLVPVERQPGVTRGQSLFDDLSRISARLMKRFPLIEMLEPDSMAEGNFCPSTFNDVTTQEPWSIRTGRRSNLLA